MALTTPRVTRRDLTRGLFSFFFQKIQKKIQKILKILRILKKIKKIKKNSKNHILTRGTLTNNASQLRLKGI